MQSQMKEVQRSQVAGCVMMSSLNWLPRRCQSTAAGGGEGEGEGAEEGDNDNDGINFYG